MVVRIIVSYREGIESLNQLGWGETAAAAALLLAGDRWLWLASGVAGGCGRCASRHYDRVYLFSADVSFIYYPDMM